MLNPIPIPRENLFLPREEFIVRPWTRECTPKILVVTDGSLDFGTGGTGLSEFIDILKARRIHGMLPIVETAHTGTRTADIQQFTFTSSTLSKSKYDVLFMFGYNSGTMNQSEVDVIAKFMQDGGGVFGTGDHSTLGQRLCGKIPRLRKMRYWDSGDVPSGSGTDRLTTSPPGPDNIYDGQDQRDEVPQRLYPTYYLDPMNPGNSNSKPHYLLQHTSSRIIEVFPDHPHEGECVVPTSLNGTFSLNGNTIREFPDAIAGGGPVSPDVIAKSMSAGGGFGGKEPVVPREFGAICVYDGHLAGVGRVSTDATWHHFVNMNIIKTTTPLGLKDGNPDAFDRIATYFGNIAEWLMPKRVRRCWILAVAEKVRFKYPLNEFLVTPVGELKNARKEELELMRDFQIGQAFDETLQHYFSDAAIAQFKRDLLAFSGVDVFDKLGQREKEIERVPLLSDDIRLDGKLGQALTGAAIRELDAMMSEFDNEDEMRKQFSDHDAVLEGLKKPMMQSLKRFAAATQEAVDFTAKRYNFK